MNTLKHILGQYKDFIMTVLAPLGGPWAILAIAMVDSAFFGIPLDPVIAYYVHKEPQHFLLFAVLGAAGSAIGSLVPYIIGYKGGEAFLVKRLGQRKFKRIHGMSEKYGDLALIVPAMMPPPTPFKLFVFSAGILEMYWPHFLLAIFTGRLARFAILSALTIQFGPQIVDLTQRMVREHLGVTAAIVAAVVVLVWVLLRWRRGRVPSLEEV
ncbi:MAG TPA: VTT domain-containing protein [Clostridia bacterium]|nr:VTT domain-containing protein [Clostridia bacterium]